MVIKELKIRNFGKIKDMSLKFDDKLNVIFGKNESGKTTIVTFIRFMLFGGQGRVNPVKEYFPLDMSEPSGEIVISHNDTDYLIVRNGVKKKGSYATVTNLKSGDTLSGEKAENLVSDIVGISEEMFASTIYLKDLSDSTLLAKGEILKRLENLSSSGDELLDFEKIIAELNEEKLSYTSPKRKGAVIPGIVNQLETLDREIIYLKDKISSKDELEKSLKDEERKEKELSSIVENGDDEADETLYRLNDELSKINVLISDTEKIIPYEYISLTDDEINNTEKFEKTIKGNMRYIISALFLMVSVLSFALSFIPYVISGISLICVSVCFAGYFINKKRFCDIVSKYKVSSYKELCDKKEFFVKKETELSELKKSRDKISENISVLSKSKENKKNILADNMKRTLETVTRKNRIQSELERILSYEDELKEKEYLYKEIKESLEKYSEYVKIIDDTKELITSAYEKMKNDFSPQVSKVAGSVFSFVTENSDEKIVVSEDLNLSLLRKEGFYSLSNLSRSTLDLLYFSFRMAVIENVIDNEGCLILDEAFIRYDKDRLSRVFAYLTSTSHQIIFATFSEYEMEFIGNKNEYNIINL